MIPTDNAHQCPGFPRHEILALIGRDTAELLVRRARQQPSGLTQNAPMYSDLNTTVQQSAIGNGVNINEQESRRHCCCPMSQHH
jgi:hypothetical protein